MIFIKAGDILEQVDGLTHGKLTYFVRAGYINPKKIMRGTFFYNDFSQRHLELTRQAWNYIKACDLRMRDCERTGTDLVDPQMKLL